MSSSEDENAGSGRVSLVVPGRNCAGTIGPCLEAAIAVTQTPGSPLREIIFVDDGSTDETAQVASRYPIRYVRCEGRGPGAARNTGWRCARHELVWFVDSDCVAAPDALERLIGHLSDPRVGAVGGSLGLANTGSWLARLVHEEVLVRHHAMPDRVDFLAAANVVYRREVLERLGGFDERYMKAQDAELAMRVLEADYELAFEVSSRVDHYYHERWFRYLCTQAQQGYWRVPLHRSHRGRARGDSYSKQLDHAQPPLAMLSLVALPLLFVTGGVWIVVLPPILLAGAQWPMVVKMVRRTRDVRYAAFGVLGFGRAFFRAIGMVGGAMATAVGMYRADR